MKTLAITLKNGETYTGACNGLIYGGKVYMNRPMGGFIRISGNGEDFESQRKCIEINVNEILHTKTL